MPTPPATAFPDLLVVCLCAQWCGVCRDYRSRFDEVRARIQAEQPQARFLWIDVEDEADLLHPLDIENFPTLLLAVGAEPRFLGPLTPQAQTLERLIRTTLDGSPALPDAELTALVARIRADRGLCLSSCGGDTSPC